MAPDPIDLIFKDFISLWKYVQLPILRDLFFPCHLIDNSTEVSDSQFRRLDRKAVQGHNLLQQSAAARLNYGKLDPVAGQ